MIGIWTDTTSHQMGGSVSPKIKRSRTTNEIILSATVLTNLFSIHIQYDYESSNFSNMCVNPAGKLNEQYADGQMSYTFPFHNKISVRHKYYF